ncbi:MAG: hypothetical protein NUV70_09205, partial [Caldiserica bacterium]|nr:hypothetical protein [Caldisericota bacterium]
MTENEESYTANLFYWDLEGHRILPVGETLYYLPKNVQDLDKCRPISWDGRKNLILFPDAVPSESYAQTTQKITFDPELSTVVGQKVVVVRKTEAGNRNYLVRAQINEKAVEKELSIPSYYLKGEGDKEYDVSRWGAV